MHKNKFTEFVANQELLDNLNFTLKNLYKNDELFNSEEVLEELTDKTLEVYKQVAEIHETLLKDPGVIDTSKTNNTSINKVVSDIIDIIIFSTMARQSMLIDYFIHKDDEL
jgi:hypothetical protein